MKIHYWRFLLCLHLLGTLHAQQASNQHVIDLTSTTQEIDGRLYVPIARIEGEDRNKDFIQEMRILEFQHKVMTQQPVSMSEDMRAFIERDPEKFQQDYVDNIAFMIRKYNYTPHRQYRVVVDEAYLVRKTTQAEIAELKRMRPEDHWDERIQQVNGQLLLITQTLQGEDDNVAFQEFVQTLDQQIKQYKEYEAQLPTRPDLKDWLSDLAVSIDENERTLMDYYGISVREGFARRTVLSTIYLEVSEEELQRIPKVGIEGILQAGL